MNDKDMRAEKAALRWMARRMSGEMTEREEKAFRRWHDGDPRHAAAFRNIASLQGLAGAAAERLAEDDAVAELTGLSARRSGPGLKTRVKAHWRRIAAGGAMLAAASLAATAIIPPQTTGVALASQIGQQQNVALRDGSHIHLNTASAVDVSYTRRQRVATLSAGEAFFDVGKEPHRPFIVETAAAKISVTGTSFNVYASPAGTEVSVVTGHVLVAPKKGGSVALTPGEALTVDAAAGPGPVRRFDAADTLAWRTGRARYRNEPMGDVIADLNRYFVNPLALSDEALALLPVTGEFDVTDQDTAVAALSIAFSLRAERRDKQIVLSPAPALN